MLRIILLILLTGYSIAAGRPADFFGYGSHTYNGTTLPFRLFVPAGYSQSQKYPLMLALHGSGDRGTDNKVQVEDYGMAELWAQDSIQARWPCFVLVPQCPDSQQWVNYDWNKGSYHLDSVPLSKPMAAALDLLDSLQTAFSIDGNRLYLTGLSMGGYGVWDLIMRYPRRFAAAVPMSGAGDPSKASLITSVPIWAFHSQLDVVGASQDMVTALENAGQACVYTNCKHGDCTGISNSALDSIINMGAKLLFTEYSGGTHVIWDTAYATPQLCPWVFSKSISTAQAFPFYHQSRRQRSQSSMLFINLNNAPCMPSFINSMQYPTLHGRIFNVTGRLCGEFPVNPADPKTAGDKAKADAVHILRINR